MAKQVVAIGYKGPGNNWVAFLGRRTIEEGPYQQIFFWKKEYVPGQKRLVQTLAREAIKERLGVK